MTIKLGIGMFPTAEAISVVELAQAAEAAGFESFWVPEHTHLPVGEPAFPGGALAAEPYKRSLDPFVALGAAAAATSTIRLGTGICLVIERDPIITAKEVATLDLLSGGRVLFGVGAGWNRTEMSNHGTDPRTRFALLEERIDAIRTIWREDEAEYHGRFVDFDPIWCWPKPVQPGGPPVILGGVGKGVLDRVVKWGDGWMPNPLPEGLLERRMAELAEKAAAAGRSPVPPVSQFGAKPRAAEVERLEALGVERAQFWVPSEGREIVLPLVERYAKEVSDWLGASAK